MRFSRLFGVAALAALASGVLAASADAAVMIATYTGTVRSGFDLTGEFGTAGADLSGERFTIVFTYDPATPGSHHFADAQEELVYGGAKYGPPNPGIDAKVTIGSGVVDVLAVDSSQFEAYNDGALGALTHQVVETSSGGIPGDYSNKSVSADLGSTLAPTTLTQPFSAGPSGLFPSVGGFSDVVYDSKTGYILDTHAMLNVDHLTITSGAVPEPATWGLMLAGFGALGAVQRRRRLRGAVRLV